MVESTPRSQAVLTLAEYGLLSQPITAHLVTERNDSYLVRDRLVVIHAALCRHHEVSYSPFTFHLFPFGSSSGYN